MMRVCPEKSGSVLSETHGRPHAVPTLGKGPGLSGSDGRASFSLERRGRTERGAGRGPALVLFLSGGLGCPFPSRRPREASGLESQVHEPPPRERAVPWGLAQQCARLPVQVGGGSLQLDN